MIVDGRALTADEVIEVDVCIVGAGTAGMTLARELSGQDFEVCLVESGGFTPDQATQALYEGENIGFPYYPLDTARARYFGGSNNRWHIDLHNGELGVRLRPLDAIDFEVRDWVPYSGWPFDKAHLDPYYERAQTICQIDPPTYDVADWADANRPPLPFTNGTVETIIYKFGRRKTFTEVHAEEIKQAENITTLIYANVLEVETDDTGQKVSRVRAASLEGNTFYVTAKKFVLALGGIETPRLLLLSNKVQKEGLGNQHDLVGRFFMEHLHFWSGVFVPDDANIFQSTHLYDDIHWVDEVAVIGKLALSETVLRREKLLNQNVQLMPRRVPLTFQYPRLPATGLAADVQNFYHKVMRKYSKSLRRERVKAFRLANMSEQVPHPDSRVLLADDRDSLGQRRVQLDWRITEVDVASVIRTQETMAKAVAKSGLGSIYIEHHRKKPPRNTHGGYHHMGTTRMHVDPRQGVVDENSRIHGMANVYIAGPSVFPTGGYANPVLTIVALTVRLADHLKHVMQGGG